MNHSSEIDKQKKAYELTFLIENNLRVSMHNVMVKKVGINYFTESTFSDFVYEKKNINVIQLAKERRGSERTNNIDLGYDFPYFWYLDFPVLIILIDVFWDKYFCEIFKTEKRRIGNEIINRLNYIIRIRNAIAHHRYVSTIEISDLKTVHQVLEKSFKRDYLYNFNDLALNSLAMIGCKFLESCLIIKTHLQEKTIINASTMSYWRSTFSAVYSMADLKSTLNEFELLVAIIRKYNNLPRKPGKGDVIRDFIFESRIEAHLNSVIQKVEELT